MKAFLLQKGSMQEVRTTLEELANSKNGLKQELEELSESVINSQNVTKAYVKMFRVQGGDVLNENRFRFIKNGNKVTIEGHERLYVTFKDDDRVLEYWIKRGNKAEVFTADVSETFFNKLMKEAVKQSRGKEFPDRPQFGDASKTKYSLGIPCNYFDEMINNMHNI